MTTRAPSATRDVEALREALRLLADEADAVERLALLRRAAQELCAGLPEIDAIDIEAIEREGGARAPERGDTLARALSTIETHVERLLARDDGFTAEAVRSDPSWAAIRAAARVAMAQLTP